MVMIRKTTPVKTTITGKRNRVALKFMSPLSLIQGWSGPGSLCPRGRGRCQVQWRVYSYPSVEHEEYERGGSEDRPLRGCRYVQNKLPGQIDRQAGRRAVCGRNSPFVATPM